jgi:hypothetical protein
LIVLITIWISVFTTIIRIISLSTTNWNTV